jgi:hypothetical protein
MIHHLSRERFVTLKWLVSSQPQWPHHVTFCGFSLLFLWGHELQSLSGQDACTDEVTHNSWTRFCSRLSSNSLPPKIFFLRPTHKTKSTVPQCIINFVLNFFFQTELSQNLQQLSEKARSTTEFIQRLKGMTDRVNVSVLRLLVVPFSFLMIKAFGDSPETPDLVAIYFPCACNFCSVARLIMKCHLGNPVSFILSPLQYLFLSICHSYWFCSQISRPVINYVNGRGSDELNKEFNLLHSRSELNGSKWFMNLVKFVNAIRRFLRMNRDCSINLCSMRSRNFQ